MKIYKCEMCMGRLFSFNGQYFHGKLLCVDCREKYKIQLENGKYDFTIAGMPLPR